MSGTGRDFEVGRPQAEHVNRSAGKEWMERTDGKTRREMTARELREKGARLAQEAAKLPVGAPPVN